MTSQKLIEWCAHARPGDRFTYHVGMLMIDRKWRHLSPELPNLDEIRERAKAIDTTADIALQMYQNGGVTLTQKRLNDNVYEYIATRLLDTQRARVRAA